MVQLQKKSQSRDNGLSLSFLFLDILSFLWIQRLGVEVFSRKKKVFKRVGLVCMNKITAVSIYEPRHEKTSFLHLKTGFLALHLIWFKFLFVCLC